MIPLACPHNPLPPDITSVSNGSTGGDACLAEGNWILHPTWVTTGPDDAAYKITLERSTEASPSSWTSVSADETTDDHTYDDDSGLQGNPGGSTSPVTHYRTYRIRLVRRLDGFVVEEHITSTAQITFYSDGCV